MASWTTACAALATSGPSSSGMKSIAPSSNEIRYRVVSRLLSRPHAPAAHPATDTRAVETDTPPRTHRPRRSPASLLQASFRNTGPGDDSLARLHLSERSTIGRVDEFLPRDFDVPR